jgi:Rieske Fe-S protein
MGRRRGPDAETSAKLANESRRGFMFKLGSGIMAIGGLIVAAPVVGYIFAPAIKDWEKRRSWINLGKVDQYPVGQTVLATYKNPVHGPTAGKSQDLPCWVRRIDSSSFQVFYINCAHLGCPVHWFQESRLFMCPCHGGVYYEDGARASGPPPRGLFEYDWQVVRNRLYVYGGEMPNLQIPGKLPPDEITPLTIDGEKYIGGKKVSSP